MIELNKETSDFTFTKRLLTKTEIVPPLAATFLMDYSHMAPKTEQQVTGYNEKQSNFLIIIHLDIMAILET